MGWEIHIFRKDVYYVFVLVVLNFAKIYHSTTGQSNGRCLRGMFIFFVCHNKWCARLFIHIGVGFCVAYPWLRGNAKA